MDGDGPHAHEDGTGGNSTATSASSGATAAVIPTVSVPTGLHGVTLYDGNQEWIEYAKRLENYLITNGLEDVVKWSRSPYLSFNQDTRTSWHAEGRHFQGDGRTCTKLL